MEKTQYIALTEEQRQLANRGETVVVKWMVLRPGADQWELTGSLPFDAVASE